MLSLVKRLPAAAPAALDRVLWLRWSQLILGLFIGAIASTLMIRSGLGLGPWDAFHMGIHKLTGISIGMASLAVGIVVLLISLKVGVRPGAGTVANMVLVGIFTDALLHVVPAAHGRGWAFAYYIAGIAIAALSSSVYILAELGKGPRDGFMIGVSQRMGWPVRRVRTMMELTVLIFGWLMGGTLGVGTVIYTFSIGPVTQWSFQLFGMTSTGAVQRPAPALRLIKPNDLRKAA